MVCVRVVYVWVCVFVFSYLTRNKSDLDDRMEQTRAHMNARARRVHTNTCRAVLGFCVRNVLYKQCLVLSRRLLSMTNRQAFGWYCWIHNRPAHIHNHMSCWTLCEWERDRQTKLSAAHGFFLSAYTDAWLYEPYFTLTQPIVECSIVDDCWVGPGCNETVLFDCVWICEWRWMTI